LFVYKSPYHDQSWYLCAAQRALSGAQIYGPQLVETNPPLIIWFSAIPVVLGRLLHLESILMLKVIVAVMILGSLTWCGRILRAAFPATSPAFLYLALCSLFSAELFLHYFDLGQREQLLVILLIPYILSAARGARSKLPSAELCVIGAIGGIAVCFKPQQVLILVGLELFLAAWTRSLRRLVSLDFLCAVLAVFAYIALIRLATPLYFAMIPVLRETYWAFAPYSAVQLITSTALFNLILLLAVVVFVLLRRRLRFALLSGAFLACSLAASIAFYAQHTGWAYQFYPQTAFLLLAALWIAIDLLSPAIRRFEVTWRFNTAFAATILPFFLILLPLLIFYRHHKANFALLHKPYSDKVFAQYPPQTPVYLISTSMEEFPAVSRGHLIWASRFPCLWMLPAIIQNEMAERGAPAPKKILSPAIVNKLAAQQRADATEDLQRWKPTVVMVKRCGVSTPCQGLEYLNFDALAWFLQSPAFATEWTNYRLQASQDSYTVYTRIQ
jgi:hypothetical protein